MEDVKGLLGEFVGKEILIKTHGAAGARDASLKAGEYKGILLSFDGMFIKIEYGVRKFAVGGSSVAKETMLINVAYIMSVEQYVDKLLDKEEA